MRIRLLIPECQYWDRDQDGENTYICADSHRNIDGRIEMLQYSMVFNNETDLLVTSHNFFSFPIDNSIRHNCYENPYCFRHSFIEPKIIKLLNEKVECKKPLIIGFDFMTSTKAKKGKVKPRKGKQGKKLANQEFNPNPYGGIPAVVLYLKVKNNRFHYRTHIWECWGWNEEGECNSNGFSAQNGSRTFQFRRKIFGLLSCGDIARYCHNNGQRLRKVDIYVDLSHRSLKGRLIHYRMARELISENKCCYVLITHQVTRNTIKRYCNNNYYPWIFPNRRYPRISTQETTQHEVKRFEIDRRMAGVIDVEIP